MNRDKIARSYTGLSSHYEDFHERWAYSVERQKKFLAEIFSNASVPAGATVLDCTCGIGTQLIALLQEGYNACGSDISDGQIARCRKELAERGLAAPLYTGDVCALTDFITSDYDVVISCGNSLPLVGSEESFTNALEAINSVLKPGGLLLLTLVDHTQQRIERPRVTASAVYGEGIEKRFWVEIATWESGATYRSELYFSRHNTDGSVKTDYYDFPEVYAVTAAELTCHLKATGYSRIKTIAADQTGIGMLTVIANKG